MIDTSATSENNSKTIVKLTEKVFCALNAQGSNLAGRKINRILQLARAEKFNFLALQEVCGSFPSNIPAITENRLAILYRDFYPIKTLYSTPHCLLVLFSSCPDPNPPAHSLFMVGSVHLATNDKQRIQQLEEIDCLLSDYPLPRPPIYIGGDFNCPIDALDSEDNRPAAQTHGRSPSIEQSVMRKHKLVDTYRTIHPLKIQYSHFRNNTQTLSLGYTARRLDRWYSSHPPSYAKILSPPPKISDHAFVIFKLLSPPHTPWGRRHPNPHTH
jgi:hypothetical protein